MCSGYRSEFRHPPDLLAGAISGNRFEEHWDLGKGTVDFYDMKGDLEAILDLTGKLSEIEFRAEAIPALHPGQSAAIITWANVLSVRGCLLELERKSNLKRPYHRIRTGVEPGCRPRHSSGAGTPCFLQPP